MDGGCSSWRKRFTTSFGEHRGAEPRAAIPGRSDPMLRIINAVQTLQVDVGHSRYSISIGSGLLANRELLEARIRGRDLLIVTNTTVARLYLATLTGSLAGKRVAECILPDGEQHKTLQTAGWVFDALVGKKMNRDATVLALGGGVVGDIAGFAAACYQRGVGYVQIPTTLLAQVDSSVGGKTGVNHPSGKNLIGAFHQPAMVVSDTSLLRSLPDRELSAGLAEVLKHGLVADQEYFNRTVRDMPALLALDGEALSNAIARSCQIKAGIVGRDERERHERAVLNLGHTFAHAIEAVTGFGRWLHGEAVGCGLCLAADLSSRLGLIAAADVERVADAVVQARLPARIEGLSKLAAIEAMRGDKKAHAGRIRFIVLERIGRARQTEAPDALIEATLS